MPVQTHIFYSIDYSSLQSPLFLSIKLSLMCPVGTSKSLLCPWLICILLEYFFAFWPREMFQACPEYSLCQSRQQPFFSRRPVPFSSKLHLETKTWTLPSYACCHWFVISSKPSQWKKQGKSLSPMSVCLSISVWVPSGASHTRSAPQGSPQPSQFPYFLVTPSSMRNVALIIYNIFTYLFSLRILRVSELLIHIYSF